MLGDSPPKMLVVTPLGKCKFRVTAPSSSHLGPLGRGALRQACPHRVLTSRSLNTVRSGAVETRQAARVLLTCSSTVQPSDAATSLRLCCRLATGPGGEMP